MTSETLTIEIAPMIREQMDILIEEGIFTSHNELISYVLRRSMFSECDNFDD